MDETTIGLITGALVITFIIGCVIQSLGNDDHNRA